MTDMHTIRVTNYWGDYDDLNDLLIIGPYGNREARDRDIARLAQLDDVPGSATFAPSTISPDAADSSAAPDRLTNAANLDDLVAAFRP